MERKIEIPAQQGPLDGFKDGAKSVTVSVDDIKTGASVAKKVFRKIFKKKATDDE